MQRSTVSSIVMWQASERYAFRGQLAVAPPPSPVVVALGLGPAVIIGRCARLHRLSVAERMVRGTSVVFRALSNVSKSRQVVYKRYKRAVTQ